MTNNFQKLAWFTDIHFGRGGNNPKYLKDDTEFVKWFIDEAKTRGCETCIFGGDWHDVRHSININTMIASLDSMQLLNDAFKTVWWIPGNHDLYHRASRDISSIEFGRNLPNIKIIREPTTQDNVTLLPWLVGDEHKKLSVKSRYVFAHLELPGFLMNARVEMPDVPHAAQADSFKSNDLVFTGHFHMRQMKGNIVYTGNAMPHDFNDDWDSDRGAMFMDWGGEPDFVAWPDQPLFRTMTLSQMLNESEKVLASKVTARVTIDIDISFEEAQLIKDTYINQYGLRKVELIPSQKQEDHEFVGEVKFQSVDQIVIEGLKSVKSNDLDSNKLVDVYKSLSE